MGFRDTFSMLARAIGASHTFTRPSRFIASDETGVAFRYKGYRRDGADRQQAIRLPRTKFPVSCSTWWRTVSIASAITACSPAPPARPASNARELLAVAPPSHDDMPAEPADTRPPCLCCGGHGVVIETFARWCQPRAAARRRTDPEQRPMTRHGRASLRLAAHALRAVIARAKRHQRRQQGITQPLFAPSEPLDRATMCFAHVMSDASRRASRHAQPSAKSLPTTEAILHRRGRQGASDSKIDSRLQ
jgi:hypothetical protein